MDGGELRAQDRVRAAFEALSPDAVPDLVERRVRLKALRASVLARAEDLARAVDADFGGRPRVETMMAEVGVVLTGIDWTLKRLPRWVAPERVRMPFEFWGARGRIERVPLGRVGVIGPWNYPVQLALLPMVAALAGGNRVLLKPSEHTPRTAALLAEVVHGALAPDVAQVLEGGAEAARAVAALPLDGLFFTGSTATGRKVAEAAAKNLVPVTLELGGKSPAILMPDADLGDAAPTIMAAKLFSAGQTCVAPDYLLVPRGRIEDLVGALTAATARLYPEPGSRDYAAIARPQDRERLLRLLDGQRAVPLMGPLDPPRLAAQLVIEPDPSSPLMREEIFGPILPVVPYTSVEEAVAFANARPQPLAAYVFGRDLGACERVVAGLRAGGVAINEAVTQVACHPLPFGGAGESGMGQYHGEEGFRTFTRPRSVLTGSRRSPVRMARPPFGGRVERIIRFLLR
jgi:coniferyl-aldehyde dehydrogenase